MGFKKIAVFCGLKKCEPTKIVWKITCGQLLFKLIKFIQMAGNSKMRKNEPKAEST